MEQIPALLQPGSRNYRSFAFSEVLVRDLSFPDSRLSFKPHGAATIFCRAINSVSPRTTWSDVAGPSSGRSLIICFPRQDPLSAAYGEYDEQQDDSSNDAEAPPPPYDSLILTSEEVRKLKALFCSVWSYMRTWLAR